MTTLRRASSGYLLRHPWQLLLAVLGICIGVGVMLAVDLANQSARKAFLLSMDTLNGAATHQVIGGPGGVDESLYTALRVRHGIRNIAPIVSGYLRVGDVTLQLLGVDVFAEQGFRSYTRSTGLGDDVVAPGASTGAENLVRNLLVGDAAILLSADTAAELGIRPGDGIAIEANGRRYEALLGGVLQGEDGDRLANLAIADIGVAQHWLALRGRLTRIDVRLPADDAGAEARLRELLPAGTLLLDAKGRTETTAAMSDAFMTNLTAMSLLAMLVGVFLIYNSVAFAVLQRRDLIGVLRALGVTRGGIFALVMGAALVLGVAGAAAGTVAGTWLGQELLVLVSRSISDHFFAVSVTTLDLDPVSFARGIGAGLVATLVAALFPAWEAASYAPRLAMSRSTLEARAGRLVPRLCLAGLVMMVAAATIIRLSQESLVAGLAALFVLILGFAFCIPLAVRSVTAALAPAAARAAGVTGRLAVAGIARTLSRTGVAIVALAVAVSATVGVSIMVESFRGSVSDWLATTLQSDLYVGVARGSLDPALAAALSAVPGVLHVSSSRRSWLETADGRIRLVAIDMAPGSYAGTSLRDADPERVWPRFDNDDAVLVSDAYAYRRGVAQGDVITIETASGPVPFDVAAVYRNYDADDGAVMMSRSTYERHFDDPVIDSLGIYLEAGSEEQAVIAQLRETARGRQSLLISSNARLKEISLGIFDRTFVITDVLYWLAVGVAVIGILGAMLALQLERAREFGILRSIGMTPLQTASLVGTQSALIGLLAGTAALPLGTAMAWLLIHVINRRAFGWQIDMSLSPGVMLAAVSLAVVAALAGGLYPAYRAGRVVPALAMREE